MERKIHYLQLDAVRGLAFLFIFIFHAGHVSVGETTVAHFLSYVRSHLWLGIELFFVLSSFLLTYLGLEEKRFTGKFSIGWFFLRRILRIWPLYFAFLILVFWILKPVASHFQYPMTLPDPLYYFLFISNFYTVDHIFLLRILWSIAVEEQFYILLGFALWIFRKKLIFFFAVLFSFSILFCCAGIYLGFSTYYNPVTYLADFSTGGIAAIFLSKYRPRLAYLFKKFPPAIKIAFYLYPLLHFLIFYILESFSKNSYLPLANRLGIVVYCGIFILEQLANPERLIKMEKSAFLVFTGRISYGLYVFHGLSITASAMLVTRWWNNTNYTSAIAFVISLLLTYLLAIISYHYFEQRFLKLKARFSRL